MRLYLLIGICLCWLCSPALAESVFSQLETLEKAVIIAADRIDSGIAIDSISEEDFSLTAGRQIEFALISLGAADLLEEDYYHLALYVLARRAARFDLAAQLLEYELKMTRLAQLQQWLREKLNELGAARNSPGAAARLSAVNIHEEFASLRRVLRKAGAR